MLFLAISGSLRANSTNTALLRATARLAPNTVTVTLYDGLDDLPHFSPERDTDQPPEAVARLRTLLREADAVLICTPEYIHGMPGSLKNLLDWIASSGEFVNKPVAVLSASPSDLGGVRAHESLRHTLTVLMAKLPEKALLTVPFVRQRLNAEGQLTDSGLADELRAVLNALVEVVEQQTSVK